MRPRRARGGSRRPIVTYHRMRRSLGTSRTRPLDCVAGPSSAAACSTSSPMVHVSFCPSMPSCCHCNHDTVNFSEEFGGQGGDRRIGAEEGAKGHKGRRGRCGRRGWGGARGDGGRRGGGDAGGGVAQRGGCGRGVAGRGGG